MLISLRAHHLGAEESGFHIEGHKIRGGPRGDDAGSAAAYPLCICIHVHLRGNSC